MGNYDLTISGLALSAHSIKSFKDIDTSDIGDGKVLSYNSDTGKHEYITISGAGGGLEEAPEDGTKYARQDATWVVVTDGVDGADGAQGIQGVQGEKGDKGDTGLTGADGAKGDTGDTGLQGIQGIRGEKGDKGDTGDTGPQGEQGIRGIQGNPGADGQDGSDASVTKANVEAVLTGEISSHTHAGSFSMDILELTQQTMQQHDSTADLAIEWKQQDTTNSNFTHSTSTNPEQITVVNAGWLDIRYMVGFDQDDGARLNTEAYITVNGTRVNKSTSRQTYYRGVNYGKWGDESKAFYYYASAGDVIELHTGVADGNTGFTLTRAIDTVPTITNIQIRYLG